MIFPVCCVSILSSEVSKDKRGAEKPIAVGCPFWLSRSRHITIVRDQTTAPPCRVAMAMATWVLLGSLLVVSASAANQTKVTNNPADELVALLNTNRTAHKSASLYDNPGLACIALQYLKAYQGDCGAVGGPDAKKPADSEFVEAFAPACGIKVSTLTPITGRLLGCETKYVPAVEAFSNILIESSNSSDILYNKNHTEVGAGVSGSDGGSPYFWCVLFSVGKGNTSFVPEESEVKTTRPGCFSGANDDCSGAYDWSRSNLVWAFFTTALIAMGFVFGL